MSQPTYPITGIPLPSPSEPIPLRQEINAWYSNPDNAIQVSLFIQALTTFQKMDFKDKLSYFGVAGIHGNPPVPWDKAPGNGHYCQHNKVTFPTWHRPYILLYEQRLYEIMLQIIEDTVPNNEKELWKAAAQTWRLPYWDWAAEQPYIQNYGVPELITKDKVDIVLPNLGNGTVDNPLWKFINPNGKPMGDPSMGKYAIQADNRPGLNLPWNECIATSRYGLVNSDPTQSWKYGIENWMDSNDALQHPQWDDGSTESIRNIVYRLFTPGYFSSYETFASTKYYFSHPGSDFLSLEAIHNDIHSFTGGYDMSGLGAGHMCDPPVAAFDPIFWLHHCNVDRLLAIWQILNKNKWFDKPLPGDPLPTEALQPFHVDTKGTTYNSTKIRDWTVLGYQYDVLVPPPVEISALDVTSQPDSDSDLTYLKKYLNERYGNREINRPGNIEGHKNDYILNIIYDRYALNGDSYTIHFFLGDADGEGPISKHPNHIGSMYTFSSSLELDGSDIPGCENCQQQKSQGLLSTSQIPLTNILLRHANDPAFPGLTTLLPDHVESYLVDKLRWKVTQVPGNLIDIGNLPQTKIFVMQGTVDHPQDNSELSRFYDYKPMWGPTSGKPGGAGPNDGLAV